MSGQLRTNVYVSPPVPFQKPDGTRAGEWSPIASTLIHGVKEAVLVDTAITKAQNVDLGDWIERTIPTKRLTFIYITHGHPDHWLGIRYLQKRFPGLKVVATPGTINHMEESIEPTLWNSTYGTRFPHQIDDAFIRPLAEPLSASGEFLLEGHVLKAIEVGHSDTHDSTILWVPSIRLAVCGDVVYGDVHQQLRYANTAALREEWVRAIEKVQDLNPETVVAGHKKVGEVDGTFHLDASKEYIRTFGDYIQGAKDPRDLFRLMTERYPTRFNTTALAGGCAAAFA